ncbi:phospholipase A1-like [Aricia agestis]|uniref:phospholipase A1-like n=1 Tax=Aricia agestis TaxID=91739 RepID=UPI001C209C0F|nr:phospholipase A1-like [Aricia agestis]
MAVEVSKPLEGYPHGFLSDCPGSTKEAILTKKTLQKLSFIVFKSNETMHHDRYDYFQMDQLAKDPEVDFRRKTMVFCGGYLSSPFMPLASSMGQAYKKLGYNVFMLDTLFFTLDQYPRAARVIRAVGKHTAEMLIRLSKRGFNPKNLELVGMSLGGQTISYIAKHYRSVTGVSVGKMVALEPAGPCFRNLGPELRLDKSDGDFVIHIATNIDGYGMATPVGHVNFYINGGENQPGDFWWILCSELCSHTRSFDVWQSALMHPDDFIGIQCDSVQQARNRDCFDRVPRVTNLMGPKTDRNKEGVFYVSTTNKVPYCMGKKGLDRNNDFFISVASSYNNVDDLKI